MEDSVKKVSVKIGNDELVFETGKICKQANGAVYAHYAGSAVIATVCCGDAPTEPLDYVPLSVEYNEKYYAAGKIPGGFLKRESRPKDKEILVSRLIDRPMRPLFDIAFGREIQVVPTVVSSDQINTPDIIAINASSAAVTISDIPFGGPIAAVRVALVDGKNVINPSFQQIEQSTLDIVVAGTRDGITMVEGGAKEVPEQAMLDAIAEAQVVITKICDAQIELQKICGKAKLPVFVDKTDYSFLDPIREYAKPLVQQSFFAKSKVARHDAVAAVKKQTAEKFADVLEEKDPHGTHLSAMFDDLEYVLLRDSILTRGVRVDGRTPEEIRPITCETGVLARTHGSALFTRGETQSLGVTTLGTASDEQLTDNIDGDKTTSSFMLHYNFPPYSVGETGKLTTGRREIGHGHLAQRALEYVIPSKEKFPYTIRVVSEILESNGSSSQASVCSGCLSLMDAGVPIKKMVAGVAMGLITADSTYSKYVILSDILGEEDHLGDMDFKVAGTEDGITAFQMDIKIAGVSQEIMTKALQQAKRGRLHILGIMKQCISKPKDDISEYAPKILTTKVAADKIGAVIGTGGKTIKAIAQSTGAEVNIDEDGTVTIYGKNNASAKQALEMVHSIVEEPEVGKVYQGTVKRIMDFGAFIEILPGKEGLCHISKLARNRVNNVSDVLSVGQVVPVVLTEIDRAGRLNLSYIDAIDPKKTGK
ncbi:MAG: polyribonucleotide nucleotidyltransferase [Sphaerochaetaceae bacterium]|jgi:polyribonucleotide nucleotidyltransferase|nr:polyribonucleotide nucleotidyltransferase [Sphaerochaetaceae bacterium]MDD3163455.1 polyribonucleotide nucleotidyltransferase [Sphaerochaetaceae bacterium]MDD4006742.1 polyribonucleotide nucleotidyltransferase [Sphaerochaetaceae bacterium]MDD4397362.1 polyribonucleotide nucleotidyltransferase [Sphaerochaetaceae bacterium]